MTGFSRFTKLLLEWRRVHYLPGFSCTNYSIGCCVEVWHSIHTLRFKLNVIWLPRKNGQVPEKLVFTHKTIPCHKLRESHLKWLCLLCYLVHESIKLFRLLPKIYLTFNSSHLFHFKTYVLKESYLKAASIYIIEIIYPEDPCPMEDAHVKRNPYSVCAKRNIRKSRGVSTDL